MRTTLILADIYNISGGVALLFLPRLIAPLIHFNDSGPGLFRMFVGGTAVLFGAAYIAVLRDYRRNRPLLVCGTVLKYWAFAISLFGFLGNARNSVESRDSRVTHSTTPFSVWQPLT